MEGNNAPTPSSPGNLVPYHDEENPASRVVAFPDDIHDEKHTARPKGVEMKRSITQEDRELAAAGYEHLDGKQKDQKHLPASSLENEDIHEHKLDFVGVTDAFKTSFDAKDPGRSFGLASEEAKARLAKDGPNILTPPKKKSALRKVFPSRLTMTFTKQYIVS